MEKFKLPKRNSTKYPVAVQQHLANLYKDTVEYDVKNNHLKYNQLLPYEFFRRSNTRGLLLAHSMGHGKTRLAVACAEDYDGNVLVILPKSLEENFRKTIYEYRKLHNNHDTNIDKYKFVSLNSNKMFDNLVNLNKSKKQIELEKKFDISPNTLHNKLVIIDEAHNLFNAITNGSKNAIKLYDLIMDSHIKLLFLSGTPIINNPFELVPCYNMLTKTTLFTENYQDFEHYFIDKKNKKIKNKQKFINRIYGLTSYYGDLYFDKKKQRQNFPEEELEVVRVPLSDYQLARYLEARSDEQAENKKGYADTAARFSGLKGGSTTYRVKSRQISNYAVPENKDINKITTTDLLDKKYSTKFYTMLDKINNHNGPGVVYSQFVKSGLNVFAKVLKANGWEEYKENTYGLDTKTKKFAILSGNINIERRTKLLKIYNSRENYDKGIIKLLLVSSVGSEGIDLKRVRHLHIMEPFWNYARINQVKTRAIRYGSHSDLPKIDQKVNIFIYLSDYPKSYPKQKIKEYTTDVELYLNAVSYMKIINSFMHAMAESSIDCAAHHDFLSTELKKKINCLLCSLVDKKLFINDLHTDMKTPNYCVPPKTKKVKVEKIEVDGKEFYYDDDKNLYWYDQKIKSYTRLPRTHKLYGAIMRVLY